MTDIKTLENRLKAAVARIEAASVRVVPANAVGEVPTNAGDNLAEENAQLKADLAEFISERQKDVATINSLMKKVELMMEANDA